MPREERRHRQESLLYTSRPRASFSLIVTMSQIRQIIIKLLQHLAAVLPSFSRQRQTARWSPAISYFEYDICALIKAHQQADFSYYRGPRRCRLPTPRDTFHALARGHNAGPSVP